ncbi:hypothetical protein CGC20_27470 [Leishmania donovani]|uniref:Uncharacterized_protein_family_UPF0029_-_putative n=3 Tax=Leishmania donovani species complex TaxID=38574 RepID=A0A6L0XUZ7_LEIIN|nr:conserved hypothetical protein [Leishmania infantum JPCM5]TPP41952.1 hypothetical protein CGC20_27470 [Leishmania donovani]CAC9552241.1 Uncharacterized_protein_family_UPF0029_-_putative [Leishmania infantum]CAM72524.1 conserved hypothetical protein [Leishmania infantum JPCM5]SUZ46897.1 Uncharacterized_protein_family_UPF0029_-_putative [Leishmania infantum]|eukprot:XP_001469415.1 conserved hypothetical protein [Leishmania infantum JPCM5]
MSVHEEEIDMILSMFSDECKRYEGTPDSVIVHLPFHFELQVTLPPHGYPDASYPQLYLLSSPNAQLTSAFSQEVNRRMRDELPLGIPMLALLIPLAQSVAEELKDVKEKAEKTRQDEAVEEMSELQQKEEHRRETGIAIWSGEAIVDRRSRFVAHMARVHSMDEVREVVGHLRSVKSIACAAHPAIYAYRFTDTNGVLQKDSDDDGESGASIKMMFLLDHLQVDGYVVVVTRWWGGILLGPDRFKHIMEVTKNLLLTIPEREKEMAASAKRKPLR